MIKKEELDPVKRLEELEKRVKELETLKIRTEQDIQLLQKQHTELKEELKQNGIENVDDLPNLISQLEQEFNQQLNDAENQVEQIQSKISSIQ